MIEYAIQLLIDICWIRVYVSCEQMWIEESMAEESKL